MRGLGVQLIVYIDHILVLAESKELLENQVRGTDLSPECLGYQCEEIHHQSATHNHQLPGTHSGLSPDGVETPSRKVMQRHEN